MLFPYFLSRDKSTNFPTLTGYSFTTEGLIDVKFSPNGLTNGLSSFLLSLIERSSIILSPLERFDCDYEISNEIYLLSVGGYEVGMRGEYVIDEVGLERFGESPFGFGGW